MTFSDDLRRFAIKVEAKTQQVFVGACNEALNSIKYGSPVTGSPGQPVSGETHADVRGGNLRESWILEFEDANHALISTNCVYAPPNEYGIREDGGPYVQRSGTGGRHSVELTRIGIQRIVEAENARLG